VGSAAARCAVRILIRWAERRAETLADATAISTSTPTHAAAAAAARTRAGGPPVAVAAESVSHGHDSGTDAAGDDASRRAADSGPSVDISSGAPGPGIWGFPSDRPAASDSQAPSFRRARARAPPAVIRGVRDGSASHLQDASEIVKAEWDAVEASTTAHCWVKSTILPHAHEVDVIALHGEYRTSSVSLGSYVNSVVSLMSGCRFGGLAFGDDPAPMRELAMQSWLTGEDDEEVRAATADRTVFEGRGGGDAADGDGSEHLSGSGSD